MLGVLFGLVLSAFVTVLCMLKSCPEKFKLNRASVAANPAEFETSKPMQGENTGAIEE